MRDEEMEGWGVIKSFVVGAEHLCYCFSYGKMPHALCKSKIKNEESN
jgi:hypothetical protein